MMASLLGFAMVSWGVVLLPPTDPGDMRLVQGRLDEVKIGGSGSRRSYEATLVVAKQFYTLLNLPSGGSEQRELERVVGRDVQIRTWRDAENLVGELRVGGQVARNFEECTSGRRMRCFVLLVLGAVLFLAGGFGPLFMRARN